MGKTTGVILSEDLREKLEEKAREEERSISWIIRKAIEEYVTKTKEE